MLLPANRANSPAFPAPEMKSLRLAALLLVAFIGVSACVDSTLPVTEQGAPTASSQGSLLLPPVVVAVPRCDPLADLSWCEDDDGGGVCTTSADWGSADRFQSVSGCETGGTGGTGGTGSTGGTGGTGGGTSDRETSQRDSAARNDYDPDMAPPDCTKPVLANWEHAYCTSQIAADERLRRTVLALHRVSARGGECANIAAVGQAMLDGGEIRYFPHVESIHGDYAGWGAPELGALLATFWVDDFGGTESGFRNFDNKLIHEVEHAMGRPHFPDANSDQTPNSLACSGL